jgi:NitT/TauT family transport system permease protein
MTTTDAHTSGPAAPASRRTDPATPDERNGSAAPVPGRNRRTERSGGRRVLALVGPPLGLFVLLMLAWETTSLWLLDPRRQFLLPPPQEVLHDAFVEPINRSAILSALLETARVSATGFLIATCVGVAAAVLMNQSAWIERTLYPYAIFIQTVPILAITPLVGFWMGFNFQSRLLVCVIISLFPIITNTLFGLKSPEPNAHNLFTLASASRLQRLLKLELPSALPAIFTGLRIAAGGSVIGAVVGDFFFRQGTPGLGRLLDTYSANLLSAQLLGVVLVSAGLGITVFFLVGALERRVVGRWSPRSNTRRPRPQIRKARS